MRDPIHLEDILIDRVTEDDLLEVPLNDKVFQWLFAGGVILVAIILGQLGMLGVWKHEFYAARAHANTSDVKTSVAPRGAITDRFGQPLVRNKPSFNVFLVPRLFPEDSEKRSLALRELESVLGKDVTAEVGAHELASDKEIFLTNMLTQDQIVALSSAEYPWLRIDAAFRRAHETPLKFGHVIGYTGLVNDEEMKRDADLVVDDEIGKTGLELNYDQYLRGVDGKEVVFRDTRGNKESSRMISEPRVGGTLHTFLDGGLQRYFYDKLQETLDRLGRKVGVGIALDPRNGEVLALVNIPSFDVTRIGDALRNPDQPIFNRAISGLYNPGSTIKPLVALAALSEGVIHPEDQIYSGGFIEVPNPYEPDRPSRFLDWKAHGWVDLRSALARSSNIYFYTVGGGFGDRVGLGITRLKKWWEKFGLGSETSIDLVGEAKGLLPDPSWKEKKDGSSWRIGDTYNVSIGQGDLLITPIELVNYVSAIANGGVLYKPRVAKEIVDDRGNTLAANPVQVLRDLRPELAPVLQDVREGMRDVAETPSGTAYLLHELPFAVAAKTGTAQIAQNTRTNAFFIGYAPFDNPQIALIVLVENSREGGMNTIPVARDVLMWYYENRILDATKL